MYEFLSFTGCDTQCLSFLSQKKEQALFKPHYIKEAMLRKKERKKSKLKEKERNRQTDRQTDEKEINQLRDTCRLDFFSRGLNATIAIN